MYRVGIDKVTLAGAVIGFLSLGFHFVILRPNRLSSGEGLFVWNSLSSPETLLLALLWLCALGTGFSHRENRPFRLAPGLIGNVILVLVFFLTARMAWSTTDPNLPFLRISIGFGGWMMAFASYILILSSQQKLEGEGFLRLLVSFSGMAALVVLFASGYMSDMSVIKEFSARQGRFLSELSQHLILAGSSVCIATVIGTGLGVWAFRSRFLERPVFFFVNTVQTLPSLALFGLMIAPLALLSQKYPVLRDFGIQGIGWAPALIALSLYALLPITRNTYTSLRILDPDVIEAGRGMGMNGLQLLWRVEIPLSLPIILSGIRTALVQSIGNTTVAALIGAGGLGVFVFQGLGQAVPDLILLGAVPVILLSVFTDKLMALLIHHITPKGLDVGQEPAS
ncbi:MAG: ABC transporter permease [Deltaproteobacteria bacterium]|nr:ABC transporter permease [Deltaproteobacteria bacterium]